MVILNELVQHVTNELLVQHVTNELLVQHVTNELLAQNLVILKLLTQYEHFQHWQHHSRQLRQPIPKLALIQSIVIPTQPND
jgi:hypothetical protein